MMEKINERVRARKDNMKNFKLTHLVFTVIAIAILATTASAKPAEDQGLVKVTVDNFVRAASDYEFQKYVALAKGINKFYHFRKPSPIDQQSTIRMNRDTLYSVAIVDISKGATLIMPETNGRYMTAMIVSQDHYIPKVFSGAGKYKLDVKTLGTPYVMVALRTLVDPNKPGDIPAVNALQDKAILKAKSSRPFVSPNYDKESFDAVLKASLELAKTVSDTR